MSSRGNALFIILIAIVLLASLSYTVTRSNRASGNLSRENAMIHAGEILNYAQGLQQAVHRVMYNGVETANVSFETTALADYDHTPAVATTNQVFNTAGGGAVYVAPKADWIDSALSGENLYGEWYFPAELCVSNVGTGTATCNSDAASNEELIAILPFLHEEICLAINDKLGVTNPSDAPPAISDCAWTSATPEKFTGTLADGNNLDAAELDGKSAGCFAVTACAGLAPPTSYHFFQVLVAR